MRTAQTEKEGLPHGCFPVCWVHRFISISSLEFTSMESANLGIIEFRVKRLPRDALVRQFSNIFLSQLLSILKNS